MAKTTLELNPGCCSKDSLVHVAVAQLVEWMCTNILNILKFPELFSDEWLKLSELLILAVCNMASVKNTS